MTTNPINAVPGTTAASFSNAVQGGFDKQEFLNLLVAQLQNQDPLSPLKGQEFASQLAQFSSVEQLTSIDSNLQQSISSNVVLSQTITNTLATALIGKQVTAQGNQIDLSANTPVDVPFRLGENASTVKVTITDAAGNIVRTIDEGGKSSGIRSVAWDGKDEHGDALPEGIYNFSIEASKADGSTVVSQELIRGIASSLQYNNGSAVLKVGQIQVSFGDVLEISSGFGGAG